jgi:hypothetical protein
MARKTIAQEIIEKMEAEGKTLLGKTSGTYTFRKGSNLAAKLESMGLTKNDVDVRCGARAGQHQNDGYQLLIFSR